MMASGYAFKEWPITRAWGRVLLGVLLAAALGGQGAQAQPIGLRIVNDSDRVVRVRVNCAKPLIKGVLLEPGRTLFHEMPVVTRPCLVTVSTLAPDPTTRSLRVDVAGTTIIVLDGRLPHTIVLEAVRDRADIQHRRARVPAAASTSGRRASWPRRSCRGRSGTCHRRP